MSGDPTPMNPLPANGARATDASPGSPPRLQRRLSSFGVLLLTLSCLSPVFSVYGVGSDVLQHAGTGAAGPVYPRFGGRGKKPEVRSM